MDYELDANVTIVASDFPRNDDLLRAVAQTIRTYGIAKIKNAMDVEVLTPVARWNDDLFADLDTYRRDKSHEASLQTKYQTWNIQGYEVSPGAVEHPFANRTYELYETRLFAVMERSPILPIMHMLASYHIAHHTSRIRVAFPRQDPLHPGGLRCHIEHKHYPGSHVLWIPLVEQHLWCNRDTPGVGFLIRERAQNEALEDTLRHANNVLAPFLHVTQRSHNHTPVDMPEYDFQCYIPETTLGDAIVFDSFVPHFSYFPNSCFSPRASFDMRMFPAQFATLNTSIKQIAYEML